MVAGFTLFFVALFAPALFSGSYMASGDAILQGLPTYFGRTPLWEPNLMLGYPLFADPNAAFWYPVLRVMRLIPQAFNAYAILPYVLGAVGMAGFARRISGSTTGGIVAGLTFSLGGFMTSHQGHLNLIHPAAWTPYLLWAIEELRRRTSVLATVAGAAAFGLSALSGPQQPLVYVALIGLVYAIVFRPKEAQTRYWLHVALLFALGVGLSAIALIPTAEFVPLSSRDGQTYADYIVFSTPAFEFVIRALFPYVLGDPAGFVESSNYAGIVPLMLGALALARSPDRRQVWFWFGAALWSAWMSIGDALGGASVAFHIPIYSLFRIPGRHALEFTMAIAALSAFGVATIEQRSVRARDLAIAIGPLVCVFAAVLIAIAPRSAAPASALAIPSVVFAASVIAVLLWSRLRNRKLATAIGIVAAACDLLSFAGLSYRRYDMVPVSIVTPPEGVAQVRDALVRGGYRILAPLGSGQPQAIPPNLSTLWEVPAVGGYVSLEDRHVAKLLQMLPMGEVVTPALPSLDLVGTRYMLFAPSTDSLDGFIGADHLTLVKTVAYAVPSPHPFTAVELVSALGDSTTIPDRARVADLTITDDANHSFAIPVLAGRDTSESAYQRPDVRPHILHRQARVFSRDAQAQLYVTRFAVPTRRPLTRIAFRWRYADPRLGALSIVHVALIDGVRATPVLPIDRYYADGHWRLHGTLAGDMVLENERAMPAAWMVPTVRNVPEDAQLPSVVHGFDFRTQAVTSDEPGYKGTARANGTVLVAASAPTERAFTTACVQRCMLVVNQLFYPGWQATVDDASVPIVRVDYLLAGIDLPPGRHTVRLWFAPRSLFIGATISALSLVVIALLLIFGNRAVGRAERLRRDRNSRIDAGL